MKYMISWQSYMGSNIGKRPVLLAASKIRVSSKHESSSNGDSDILVQPEQRSSANRRATRCCAFHPSSLMMRGISAYSKLPESRPTPHRDLTENWQIGQSFTSHIFNMRENKWCFVFHSSSLIIWGLSAYSKFTERRLKRHRELTNKSHSHSVIITSICNNVKQQIQNHCSLFNHSTLISWQTYSHSNHY